MKRERKKKVKMFRRCLAFFSTTATTAPIEGPALATIAGKSPIKVSVKKGVTYSWCSCGLSQKAPFCDGSHKKLNEEQKLNFRSVKFTAEEDGDVFFCQCKKTGCRPFCDGTHANL